MLHPLVELTNSKSVLATVYEYDICARILDDNVMYSLVYKSSLILIFCKSNHRVDVSVILLSKRNLLLGFLFKVSTPGILHFVSQPQRGWQFYTVIEHPLLYQETRSLRFVLLLVLIYLVGIHFSRKDCIDEHVTLKFLFVQDVVTHQFLCAPDGLSVFQVATLKRIVQILFCSIKRFKAVVHLH